MLILSVIEIGLQIDEVGEFCTLSWVYEGIAHKEDLLTCAFSWKTWDYGLDEKTKDMRLRHELIGFYLIQMTIRRIRKHNDWLYMYAGHSGLFNFEASDDTIRILLERYVYRERRFIQPTLKNPSCDLSLALADSEESARLYFRKMLEYDFEPLTA